MLFQPREAALDKFALDIDEDTDLGQAEAELTVDIETARATVDTLGHSVLLFRRDGDTSLTFLGNGRIAAVETGLDEAHRRVRIEDIGRFDFSVPAEAEPGLVSTRRMLRLTAERFEEIVTAGGSLEWAPGLAEAQAAFIERDVPTLETYEAIHDLVLQRWEHRCAFTERQFAVAAQRPHPELQVVAIHPREMGGPLHVRNFLPMTAQAAEAWNSGHITLGSRYEFWVAKDCIDPEFEGRLRPAGRLLLPADQDYWPDPEQVRFHREHVFAL